MGEMELRVLIDRLVRERLESLGLVGDSVGGGSGVCAEPAAMVLIPELEENGHEGISGDRT